MVLRMLGSAMQLLMGSVMAKTKHVIFSFSKLALTSNVIDVGLDYDERHCQRYRYLAGEHGR